jgi:Family of unknown function (DUF5317)
MLLALPLFAGLLIGKLTGGSFRALAAAPLRAWWLLLVSLAIQLILFTPLTDTASWDIHYSHAIYVVSLLLLLGGLLANIGRLRWPLVVLAAGAALNLIVIGANGGAMPVDGHLLALAKGQQLVSQIMHHSIASNVAPITRATNLSFLGDRVALASSVYSVGDVLIGLGGFLLVLTEMHRRSRAVRAGIARFRQYKVTRDGVAPAA